MKATLTILTTLALLALAGVSAGQQTAPPAKAPPPTGPVELHSCATAECHADIKDHLLLHGPVNVNACNACHTLRDAKTHQYELKRQGAELCHFCHLPEPAPPGAIVHEPVLNGECAGCHNPHGGNSRTFLKGQTLGDMCNTCHEPVGNAQHVHGPVAAGSCGACHVSHMSANPKLLVNTGRALCIECHQDMARQLTSAQFVHEPVKQNCMSCHDPHASDYTMMVKQSPLKLCTTECHEEVRHAVTAASHEHSAVTQDEACVNCHTAHGSDLARLMRARPADICLKCHHEPVEAPEGRIIPSVAEIANPELNRHGPLRDGTCGGCHDVHGSDVSRLLTKAYSKDFYDAFEVEKFDLCFGCHDQQLVMKPKAGGLTKFRNGDDNLHFLHVNKEKRGRNCRACHETHASRNPMHIRDSVPYGQWQMPINYTQSDTGGACQPGCHQPFAYDREKPVEYPRPEPGPLPGTVPTLPGVRPIPPPAPPTPIAPPAPDTSENQP